MEINKDFDLSLLDNLIVLFFFQFLSLKKSLVARNNKLWVSEKSVSLVRDRCISNSLTDVAQCRQE